MQLFEHMVEEPSLRLRNEQEPSLCKYEGQKQWILCICCKKAEQPFWWEITTNNISRSELIQNIQKCLLGQRKRTHWTG
jgi:hypothetical protein